MDLEPFYRGKIALVPATSASLELATQTWQLLHQALGDTPRQAQFQLSDNEFFKHIGDIRKTMFNNPRYTRQISALLSSIGIKPASIAIDPIRLRAVLSDGHLNPAAKSVYYCHRDTWYSHPNEIITCWIALHDCGPDNSFEIYPDALMQPVNNDSEIFDYGQWVETNWEKKIGWQNKLTGTTERYPHHPDQYSACGDDDAKRYRVKACKGDVLLFSGAHLHQTNQHSSGSTRFSLDLRFANLDDVRLNKAVHLNVDNRSTGSALPDYVKLADVN